MNHVRLQYVSPGSETRVPRPVGNHVHRGRFLDPNGRTEQILRNTTVLMDLEPVFMVLFDSGDPLKLWANCKFSFLSSMFTRLLQ